MLTKLHMVYNKTMSDIDYAALSTELDGILDKLQSEQLDVNEAIELYERGMRLTKDMEAYLKTAENKIKKVKASFNQSE